LFENPLIFDSFQLTSFNQIIEEMIAARHSSWSAIPILPTEKQIE